MSITPNAGVWANSAYVELLAATPTACVLTGVTLFTTEGGSANVTYDAEVDIATGAAGAEAVIATVRLFNRRSFSPHLGPTACAVLPIPIDNIGTGVRLAARLRKNSTTTTVWKVAITYLRKPLASTMLTTVTVAKVLPPAAVGVTLTAGGGAWTSGTWGQLRAATGAALVITGVVFGNPSVLNAAYELDLGTGAAAAETVITTIRFSAGGTAVGFPSHLCLPTPLDNVAASTRLAARLRCATASATVVASVMVLERPL